jgi:hypothetical protein
MVETDVAGHELWDFVQAAVWIWKRDKAAAMSVCERFQRVGRPLADWRAQEPEFKKALRSLLGELSNGRPICLGRSRLGQPLSPISPLEWSGLEIADRSKGITAFQRGDALQERDWLHRLEKADKSLPGPSERLMWVKLNPPVAPRAWHLRVRAEEIMAIWPERSRKDYTLLWTIEALKHTHPDGRYPKQQRLLHDVNTWLESQGRAHASPATLKRAKAEQKAAQGGCAAA